MSAPMRTLRVLTAGTSLGPSAGAGRASLGRGAREDFSPGRRGAGVAPGPEGRWAAHLCALCLGAMETPNPFLPRSPEARAISTVFTWSLVAMAVIVALVMILVLYASIRYHATRVPADPAPGSQRRWPEIAWTAAPAALLVALFVLSAWGMSASDPPSASGTPDVVIVGHRWWWEYRYPARGVVTANELHLPVGRRLLAEVRSADVIHDFWVPQLGRKMDATPGHPTRIWLAPSRAGTYAGTCAEYCGAGHAWMRLLVVAEAEDRFEAWLTHQAAPIAAEGDSAARGARLFRSLSCASCHALGAAAPQIGPDLAHLAARTTLAAGALQATREDLARWLADPQRYKPGALMPNFHLAKDDLDALVEYLWRP